MARDGRYELDAHTREAYEALNLPIAVYQFLNDKCITLLVSDGLCRLLDTERTALTYQFDTDMFGNIHPDDMEYLANLGMQYAIHSTNYDTVVRVKRPDGNGYMRIHTTARPAIMDDGTRIDFFTYADVTEIDMGIKNSIEMTVEPKGRFLDENVSAVAVLSKKHNILFYCNNAMKALLPPQINFDSTITFDEYFYPDIPGGIQELKSIREGRVYTVTEPRTGRRLNVNAIACEWLKEPCYALYFYEINDKPAKAASDLSESGDIALDDQNIDTIRKAFNTAIFAGEISGYQITDPEYRGYSVWNLETGELTASSGVNCLVSKLGRGLKYNDYILAIADHLEELKSDIVANWNSKRLSKAYETDTYTHNMKLSLWIGDVLVPIQLNMLLMRSPDDKNLYARFSEENITNQLMNDNVLINAVTREIEFAAYINIKAGTCQVLYGQTSNETERHISAKLGEYYPILSKMLMHDSGSIGEFIHFIEEECESGGQSIRVFETQGGKFKSVRILLIDREEKLYYITRIDVTDTLLKERKREHELTAAKEKAEKASLSVQQFLSSVSHDLRTPLNGVLGFTELALKADDIDLKQNYIEKIAASADLMLGLVNDVLDTSKIESGQMELLPQVIDCKKLLTGIRESVGLLAEQKKIAFHCNMDSDCPRFVKTDPLRLQQLVLNLLSNAVKYTPEKGEVWFSVHMFSSQDSVCTACITVRDNGIGMSDEYQARMFDPFSQERQLRYTETQGTGLGLFIVRKIVELMNGVIEVESKIGQGTTFTLYIPIEKADQCENGVVQNDIENTIEGARILMAEDNDLNAEIAVSILIERCKAIVDRTTNGEEAVNKFINSSPGYYDAILMDIRMPVMDGIMATKAIRSSDHADAKTIPVIAMTADIFADDVSAYREAGMNGHIAKPIDQGKLVSVLKDNIDRND